jgi:methionyl-tRNA synthetase
MSKILITSALPYINGVKHLGNLAGSLLPADVHARFRRQTGDDVLFICGTDEHGTPAELGAIAAARGSSLLRGPARAQTGVYRRSALRSIILAHLGAAEPRADAALHRRLGAAGLIDERSGGGCGRARPAFLPDRYVLGTCPRRSDERGDQCDDCGALLDQPIDRPALSASGDSDLSVRAAICSCASRRCARPAHGSKTGGLAALRGLAGKSWLVDLRDRCITRDLAWGVPVPASSKARFYVWLDAPIGYIAAAQVWSERDPRRNWRDCGQRRDVKYIQFPARTTCRSTP